MVDKNIATYSNGESSVCWLERTERKDFLLNLRLPPTIFHKKSNQFSKIKAIAQQFDQIYSI